MPVIYAREHFAKFSLGFRKEVSRKGHYSHCPTWAKLVIHSRNKNKKVHRFVLDPRQHHITVILVKVHLEGLPKI